MQLGFARRKPPPLWLLLVVSNMAVLALPITALWAMRVYESALVGQTQDELVAQAVVWSAAVRAELGRLSPGTPAVRPHADSEGGLSTAAVSLLSRPGVDLAIDPVLPPPPDAAPATRMPDPLASAIGRALSPMIEDAQPVALSALRLTDAYGVIIATTGTDLGKSLASWQEVASVLAGAPIATALRRREPWDISDSVGKLSRPSGLRVFVVLPVQGNTGLLGTVVLFRTPRDMGQAVWAKRWELGALVVSLLAAGGLLAAGLSRLVTRPLAVVVAQAQFVASGGQATPLRRPGTREVADLSAALTRMAAMLDQRARYIIAFAASVSHEFKTPLAGLRGAAELLEDHADTLPADERGKLLRILARNTQRLDQLVRRLLDLARADMMRPGAGSATNVGGVLQALLPTYLKHGMAVHVDVGTCTVALPADALSALLASLFDNAAAHASTDGRGAGASLTVSARSQGRRTWITVKDDGPGISPANHGRVFEPFFTTSRDQGGTGLGLSIVRAMAQGVGGAAELLPSEHGACFCIELPAEWLQEAAG
ncbi:MAG: HAMP domain-containing sensor histidine kinase [Janthinobacterium lividum]